MAGVQDPNFIDVVARDPGEGPFVLYMVEDRRWDAGAEQLEQLKRKISNYASYVLDGDLGLAFPETINHPVRIQLDCVQAPTPAVDEIVGFSRARLEEYGLAFAVHVRS